MKSIAEQFCTHRKKLLDENFSPERHYLIPLGIIKKSQTTAPEYFFSIFESTETFVSLNRYATAAKAKQSLIETISKYYKYIHIPSEVDFKEYTKIEGKTIQALLGREIDEIVRGFIKKETIQEINRKLNDFLKEISSTLELYEYKKPARKQNLFNQSHFTEKVIEAFFESKVLTRKTEKDSTPVTNLSSGEKRKALIDVARAFLLSATTAHEQRVILAIDEPELSLHISACFDQFEKIKEISSSKAQTLVATHWYGFMPAVSKGAAVYCTKSDSPTKLIDLRCFRDEIKKLKEESRGQLPTEIELKGITDLVQSITASITGSDYKWIICEGASDKIYLDFYFSGRQIYVVPVGGSRFVKKIYNYISMALEDHKESINGRIFMLLDTDKKFEKFEANDSIEPIRIRRIQNSLENYNTELKKTSDNSYYPPTTIEDALDATSYKTSLESFKKDAPYSEAINALGEISIKNPAWPSTLALDLRSSDTKIIDDLFKLNKFKIKFALKYVSIANPSIKPDWIAEIETFLFPEEKTKAQQRMKSKTKQNKGDRFIFNPNSTGLNTTPDVQRD